MWFLIGGLPGLFAYKAINTLDSMWGYRNDTFEQFGKIAARMDDAANWLPARLTAFGVSMTTGTLFAFAAALRDGPKHRSVNAGYPEAVFASALQGLQRGDEQRLGTGTRNAPGPTKG